MTIQMKDDELYFAMVLFIRFQEVSFLHSKTYKNEFKTLSRDCFRETRFAYGSDAVFYCLYLSPHVSTELKFRTKEQI